MSFLKWIGQTLGDVFILKPDHKKTYRLRAGKVNEFNAKYHRHNTLRNEFYITNFDDKSVEFTTYLHGGNVRVTIDDFWLLFEVY